MAKKGELTPKQAAFVREYLKDGNGTQAAIRAGYSAKTAGQIAEQNLKKVEISSFVKAAQLKVAEKTESDAEWVRRRLKEEADDFSEFASHSARIKAIELIAKLNGQFEVDNKQKTDGLVDVLGRLGGAIAGVVHLEPAQEEDDGDS